MAVKIHVVNTTDDLVIPIKRLTEQGVGDDVGTSKYWVAIIEHESKFRLGDGEVDRLSVLGAEVIACPGGVTVRGLEREPVSRPCVTLMERFVALGQVVGGHMAGAGS